MEQDRLPTPAKEKKYADISFFLLIKILWKRKLIVIAITFFGCCIALVGAIRSSIAKKYIAEVTFVSTGNNSDPLGALTLPKNVAGLLGQSGGSFSSKTRDEIVALNSRKLMTDVIEKLDLLPLLFEKNHDPKTLHSEEVKKSEKSWRIHVRDFLVRTLVNEKKVKKMYDISELQHQYQTEKRYLLAKGSEMLRGRFKYANEPGGTIRLKVTWNNPETAAMVANQIVDSLAETLNHTSLTSNEKGLLFARAQFKTVSENLRNSERELQKFLETYGMSVGDHAKMLSTVIAEIQKEIIMEEISLQSLKHVEGQKSVKVRMITEHIKALKNELDKLENGRSDQYAEKFKSFKVSLKDLPILQAQYADIMKDINIQSELYKFLGKELETRKLQTAQDNEKIIVIDPALPPEHPEPSKAFLLMVFGMIVSFVFGCILAILTDVGFVLLVKRPKA